jgi:hypothetical protein
MPQGSPGLFAGQELTRVRADTLQKIDGAHRFNVEVDPRIVKRGTTFSRSSDISYR